MNTRLLLAGCLLGGLLGCNSARVEHPTAPATPSVTAAAPAAAPSPWLPVSEQNPPPSVLFQPLPPPPRLPRDSFRACKLGESCFAMDERPFEVCLLSTTRCADKIKEPLLVDAPNELASPRESSITVAHEPE